MGINHFDINKSDKVFDGIIAKVYHRRFGGSTFEYVVTPDVAKVIAVTKDLKIVLLREKSFAGGSSYLSLPGGSVEAGETAEESAVRELLEETGLSPSSMELWFKQNYSQTVVSNKYFFIARGCESTTAPKHEGAEKIEIMYSDFDDFIQAAISAEFKHTELQNEFFRLIMDSKLKSDFMHRLGLPR